MYASKLVMSRGKRFESARRLSKNANLQVKREMRRSCRDSLYRNPSGNRLVELAHCIPPMPSRRRA
jgi:hypothetical protein